jgi:hypothetical protein
MYLPLNPPLPRPSLCLTPRPQVALKQKLSSLQKDLQSYLQQPIAVLQEDRSAANKKLTAQLQKLVKHCEQLEDALGDTTDELDELKDQYLLLEREKDHTPGALLFFSVLSNPKLPEILATHLQSLHAVKNILEGQEHMDYMKLRRYLEGCLLASTPLQQLLKRYQNLHKKWCQQRGKQFFDRKLIGADADAFFICPLCSHDSRGGEERRESPPVALPSPSALLLQSSQSADFLMASPGGGRGGLRKGTAMRGASRGILSSRSMHAPLGGIAGR